MGSPSKEVGRLGEEVQREITLTRPFYFGVQRSGAWMFTANSCRLANRVGKSKSKSNGTMGLRVACR